MRRTKCDALLELLSDGKPHDQHEVLKAAGYRYTGRIKDLRDDGHEIETIKVKHPNVFSYRLITEKPRQLSLV